MDLNHLFARHQISLERARRAACVSSRRAHAGLAAGYAARIQTMQQRFGATFRLPSVTVDAAGGA